MATQTVDSHQTCTSDEETVKLNSEAVKVKEQINLSSTQETLEDDREKGKADNLHIHPDSTLPTSEEKALDITHIETPVLDLPLHDNVKLEKESTSVAEVATAADEIVHELVGEEATELPVIAYLEKSIKEFDASDNVKSQPEEQPSSQVTEPAATSAKKVEEQPSEAAGLPKSEDESSAKNVEAGAGMQFVIEVAEKVEIVPGSVDEVEDKTPKIIDNPKLPVLADSGKGPAEVEEEPATECVSVEKEQDKETQTGVSEESVEPPKKEAQPIEVDPVEEPIEVVAKEIIKETPVEVHPIKGLEEVITKEISEPIEAPKEKDQASEVEPGQELREVIEAKISETVEVSQESELLVEEKQAVIDKDTNECIEPLKNKEQPDVVISQKESVEVIAQEVIFEPPKKKEHAEEGLLVTESGEVKEKEISDSTLGSEEVEKQDKEVIEVKDDGIGELLEVTKHVQDIYVEAKTVEDEKPLARGDDIDPPIEGKIKEEGNDKQDSVGQVAESGPVEDSVQDPEEKQPTTDFVTVEREPKEKVDTTSVPEEYVETPKKEAQPTEVVPVKELAEVVAKEDTEIVAPPTEKEQPIEVAKDTSEVVAKESFETVEPPIEKEQPVEMVTKKVIEIVEPPTEKVQPALVIEKETSESIEPLENKKHLDELISQKESIEVIPQEVCASLDPPKNNMQVDEGFSATESVKRLEEEHPAQEFVGVDKETREEPTITPVSDLSVEPPKKEEQPVEVLTVEEQVEVITKEIIETTKPRTEKEQPTEVHTLKESEEVTEIETMESIQLPRKQEETDVYPVQESREVIAENISETVEIPNDNELLTEVHPVKDMEVIVEGTSESIEPPKNKEQPNEVLSQKESLEVITTEVSGSFEPLKDKVDEGFSLTEPRETKEKEAGDSTLHSEEVVKQEPEVIEVKESVRELSELIKQVQDTCMEVETVKDEKTLAPEDDINPSIEGDKIQEGEAQNSVKSDEQVTEDRMEETEVHPLKVSKEVTKIETSESTELPTNEEESDIYPVQDSREVIAEKISETVEIPNENELLTEVQPVKDMEVITEGTTESIEPPKNKEQTDEVLSQKESIEVSAAFELPKNKDKVDEDFPLSESGEMKEKETRDSTLGSEEVVKQVPEVIEVKESVKELLELAKHVQDTYLEVETVKDEKVLAPEDDINPPTEEGKIQEEEAQHTVESDEQVTEGQMAKSDLIEDSSKGIKKEQPPEEFVSADREPRKEPETACDPELSFEPAKKEESVEILPAKEVEVIEKEIIEAVELPTEKEQPVGVQPKESEEVVEKEIIAEPTELHKKKEATEVQPVKELEVMSDDTSESIEPPKNQEQPNEVPPEKESEIIAKEINEFFVPPKNTEQADESFSMTESEEVGEKKTSCSKLVPEEVEKRELEVTKEKDGKEELLEITNHVNTEYVKVETKAIEKDESVKGEKSLASGDDSMPSLKVEQIHKEEEQRTVESDKRDSLSQEAPPSIELAAGDFSPKDVKEDEKKDSSNITVVAKSSEVEAPAIEKVGKENEEKIVKTEKADEDKYEKIQGLTLPREEVTPRDFETDVVVIEKSIGDQEAGEAVDLIAESKIEVSIADEKSALIETDNAQVNETPKEPQESELEVKDKETVIQGGEVPKVNDKKEVPSKPSHKHSHNILSKVKQSLVKAKKAIIGKSPSSKTLSSEARDDIKVK